MSYIIRKTDGSIVATVTDGTVDRVSTSLTLLGKNYKGIGEIYNTNLVSLLESFANTSPPSNQIKGQLWFNSSSSKLNVFDGNSWRPVGSPFVTGSRPANLVQGDLWIDSVSQQLKFYDGINLINAGPSYTYSQGKSGWIIEDVIDNTGNGRVIASLYVNNVRMGILTATSFSPQIQITGFPDPILAGLTFSSIVPNNRVNAPVASADGLVNPMDDTNVITSDKFLRSDANNSSTGSLAVLNSDGVTIGAFQNFKIYIDETVTPSRTVLSNEYTDNKLVIQTYSNGYQNAVEVDPVLKKVSIYPEDDWSVATPTFVVNGNTTIEGSLTVVGATQFTNSTTVQITDKNIELAVVDTPTNTTANGAGITIKGATDKTLVWNQNTSPNPSAWEFNDNVKVTAGKGFYVANDAVLNSNTLGSTVVNSSLTSVGNLTSLTAASFNFTNNVVSVAGADFVITVDANKIVRLSEKVRFANVEEPFYDDDVANKVYVDNKKTSLNYVTLDITGLSDPNVDARGALEALVPISSVNVGDELRVMCLSYTNTSLPNTQPAVTRLVKIFQAQSITVGLNTITTWVHTANVPV